MSREMRSSYVDSKTPGPGSYENPESTINHADPLWSLPKSPRFDMNKSAVVGPGAYELD